MSVNSFTALAAAASTKNAAEEFEKRLQELGYNPTDSLTGIKLLTTEETAEEIGFTKGTGSIKIAYFDIDGNPLNFARYRFLGSFNGNKYHQPAGSGNKIYLPLSSYTDNKAPNNFKSRLLNPQEPIIITEGEFKSIRCNKEGILTLGLSGVDCITTIANGNRNLSAPLSLLPPGKPVYITYDFDISENTVNGEPKKEVRAAELRLASMLKLRGCKVYFVRLGDKYSTAKIGLDDFLNAKSKQDLLEKMAFATEFKPQKHDGEHYLLSKYAILEGDIVAVGSFTVYSAPKFRIQESNCKNPFEDDGDEKRLPPARFLESLDRASLVGVTFDPRTDCRITPDNELNLWRGLKTKPAPGDVSLWTDFTKLFFSLEPELEHHFESTMALTLQKPWVKQDRLCILKSGMTGIGKSFYFETIAAIINGSMKGRPNGPFDHALVSSARDLDSSFNSSLSGKKFVLFNEIGEKGEKHTNLLKDLVTGHSITINEKYMKARSMINYIMFCITTNERFTHVVENDSRRELVYTVPKTDPLAKQLMNYFAENTALKNWVNTPEARSALLNYYLNYDIGDYNGTQRAPDSFGKTEMATALHSDIDMYILDELHEVEFVIPRLEHALLRANYPNISSSVSYFCSKLRDHGFVNGIWDKTRSQLSAGPALAKGNKELLRPVVLMRQELSEATRDSLYSYSAGKLLANKQLIVESLQERYFAIRKI